MSTMPKIIISPKFSLASLNLNAKQFFTKDLERLEKIGGLNLNAKPFFPKDHLERLEKIKLVKIEENKYYDHLENVWWQQNKNMFIDSNTVIVEENCKGPKGSKKM